VYYGFLGVKTEDETTQRRWTLDETDYRTGGPARYVTVRETGRRLNVVYLLQTSRP